MTRQTILGRKAAIALACALAMNPLLAGPPLICWKVATGGAESLPWSENPRAAEGAKKDYDTRRLAADTLALLDDDVPVLSRMETIRRAGLYAARDEKAGAALLEQLIARARPAGKTLSGEPLSLFDAGYFVATWNQAEGKNRPGFFTSLLRSLGIESNPEDALGGESGYDWVVEAIRRTGGNPDMEFAAALITWYPQRPEHDTHLARAAAGAATGSLLEQNLLERFSDRGQTLAQLRRL